MRRFAALYSELDASAGIRARVDALERYFRASPPGDAAWALHVLLGKQGKRLITGRRLRQICLEGSPLPDWLFDDCYAHVGDSAETIALLWQQVAPAGAPPLSLDTGQGPSLAAPEPGATEPADVPPGQCHSPPADPSPRPSANPRPGGRPRAPTAASQPLQHWMEQLLPAAASLEGEAQAEAVRELWRGLEACELLVANKLLTGGLRVGVGQGVVLKTLAKISGLEEALLQHRLMGGFQPSAAAWGALLAPADQAEAVPSRPYPFFLASPLESAGKDSPEPPTPNPDSQASASAAPRPAPAAPLAGEPADWLVEWKFDGIRGQLIRRAGEGFLWSRGEELINAAFPELISASAALPEGTVLDGEILVWPAGDSRPAPFAQLQRRLGRKAPGRRLLAEVPAAFVAYDLLEQGGEDWRPRPLTQRRSALEALIQALLQAAPSPDAGLLRLSPRLPLETWSALEPLRQQAADAGAEGLMLKALASPYLAGRKRGPWWKHKREPYSLDAVLLYAQAGSGRRANLFTDYTFGLWDHAPSGPTAPSAFNAAGADTDSNSPARQPGPAEGADAGTSADADGRRSANGLSRSHAAGPGDRAENSPQPRLVSFAKAYSGLNDQEITALDRWIRSHTIERFGPVRAVEPVQVFELAFEGLQASRRHRSGLAVRFPRIARWRHDKPAWQADCLETALALLQASPCHGEGSP